MLKRQIKLVSQKFCDEKKESSDATSERSHESKSQDGNGEKELSIDIKTNNINGIAARRLMREYQTCFKISNNADPAFSIELVENSLAEWNIRLNHIDKESRLYKDMKRLNIPNILLNANFSNEFPFDPPFLRVVYPRIQNGYVLTGGAICMELLTKQGWSSVYTVEAMIMQFSSQVVKGNGRIQENYTEHYSKKDARKTFKKLSELHGERGWFTPPASQG